jgi:hypothetical protein
MPNTGRSDTFWRICTFKQYTSTTLTIKLLAIIEKIPLVLILTFDQPSQVLLEIWKEISYIVGSILSDVAIAYGISTVIFEKINF